MFSSRARVVGFLVYPASSMNVLVGPYMMMIHIIV